MPVCGTAALLVDRLLAFAALTGPALCSYQYLI
jgi:hypothetical protein